MWMAEKMIKLLKEVLQQQNNLMEHSMYHTIS